MLDSNVASLVKMAVQGQIAHPLRYGAYELDACGHGHAVPSVGGITYNVKVGDSAFGWQGDHIEPGVSVVLDSKNRSSKESQALQFLACVGNEAIVVSGDAKGARGTVVGHHGGVEHLIVDFDDATLNRLTYDDKILIRAFGQGLSFTGHEAIKIYNCDPKLFEAWRITLDSEGDLVVPVAGEVPAALMGSGIGHPDPGTGDYDITTQDERLVAKFGIRRLRFGDFVAVRNADNTYGRHYYEGAMTIGLIVHSDSFLSGHGPGLVTLLSSRQGKIKPMISDDANLAKILKIGRFAAKT